MGRKNAAEGQEFRSIEWTLYGVLDRSCYCGVNEREIPEKLSGGIQEEEDNAQGDEDDPDKEMCLPCSQRERESLPMFSESVLKITE